MGNGDGWSRRRVLGASAGGIAAALAAGQGALAAPAVLKGTRLTYWGGLIFSDKANRLLVDTITKWGSANGVRTDVVMINQNETVQKVSAAMASSTMPDALDMGLSLLLLLARQGAFLPVDDLYDAIGNAQGGWYKPVADATDTKAVAGARTGIPFGVSGNLLLRRTDVLDKAGLKAAPATWVELADQAARVSKPPLYGLGLALSNVGDGDTQVSVLQSFGGRMADDAGKRAAIKSAETRTYLQWVKDAWDRKLFPPGNTTWDGAGDNNAYLAGQAVFIANTGSVGIAARGQDPELFQGTGYSSLPGGPKGVISPIDPQVRAIPKSTKNADGARALIQHLAEPDFMRAYYAEAIYGPVTHDQAKFDIFGGGNLILAGLRDLVEKGTAPGYPDVYNAAYADAWNNFIVPRMVQRVVIDHWDFDRAMDEAQTQTQAIYDKYK
jgi:multiple sugar transport system substrate-binding protein